MTKHHATPRRGLLLFAHGARDPNWALPFQALERHLAAQAPECAVALAFLEFMAPTLSEAGASLAGRGCTRIDVVPVFLGAGGHVRRDLPELLDRLRLAHPNVVWSLHPAVGELPAVIEAMAHAIAETVLHPIRPAPLSGPGSPRTS